jgi:hypothetical protein
VTQIPQPPPFEGGGIPRREVIHPDNPPRSPVVILIANLCAGIGYFLIGQKVKGILAVVLWLIVLLPTCGSGSGLMSILYAVDGFFQARQLASGTPIGPWTFFTNHR